MILESSLKKTVYMEDVRRYETLKNEFILVKERFRNQVRDCKSYPGADIDHNLVT